MNDQFSSCCQAPVIYGDCCAECREHCEALTQDMIDAADELDRRYPKEFRNAGALPTVIEYAHKLHNPIAEELIAAVSASVEEHISSRGF